MKTQKMDTHPLDEQVLIGLLRQASIPKKFSLIRPYTNPHDLTPVLLSITKICEEVRARSYIGGSIASSIHGFIRYGEDIDVVADINFDAVYPLVELFQKEYSFEEISIYDAIKYKTSFSLIHRDTLLKVDVFIPKDRPFDLQMQERAKCYVLDESIPGFYVASPEDMILIKLEQYKKMGRFDEDQWFDILGMLKVQGTSLDYEYVQQWAKSPNARKTPLDLVYLWNNAALLDVEQPLKQFCIDAEI